MALGNVAKIAIGWTIIIAGGLASFAFAKTTVVQQRQDLMRARQRMQQANETNYETNRKFTG